MRNALAGAAAPVLAFVALTWLALESGGVGIIETTGEGGVPRRTHVGPVEIEGDVWLEAGTPEGGWYLDIAHEPELSLEREGSRRSFRAVPVPTEAARRRVRAALRERFGWRDRRVGMFIDSSAAVAVRLESIGIGNTPDDPGGVP